MHQLLIVLVDIGTNDLSNGCDPGNLAEGIVAFARGLLTIPSVTQVVVCEILTRIPVQFSRFPVRLDFHHARQIANNKVRALIADLENITFYHHIKLLDKKNYA